MLCLETRKIFSWYVDATLYVQGGILRYPTDTLSQHCQIQKEDAECSRGLWFSLYALSLEVRNTNGEEQICSEDL